MSIYYFDNSATTKVKKEVIDEMIPYFSEEYGNPSSIYSLGRNSKKAIEKARKQLADLIGCKKNEIYFVGSGTEADNMAIKGIAYKNQHKGNHIITSKIEHLAVLESCKFLEKQGFEITYLNVDKNGFIDLNELRNSIREDTILISIMFANNEIGTIEPIEDIAEIAKSKNIIFHTDAVQAVGNVKIDVKKMNIDMLSISSHKIYGPKGVGALYISENIEIEKFLNGGHQEKNIRASTENVPGIVGFGKAAEMVNSDLDNHIRKLKELKNYYVENIITAIPDTKINGAVNARLPGNSNISFKNINSSDLLLELDNSGICASGGSACNSKEPTPSHVLNAIGVESEWINGAIRVTFGDFNTKEEVDYLIKNIAESVKKLRNQ